MLTELEVKNFRVFADCLLHFDTPKVVFKGGNGQGKTTLLESIFFLANIRSFRTLKAQEICSIGSSFFSIRGIHERRNWKSTLQIHYGEGKRLLQIDHVPVSRTSDFTGRMRCIAFLPEDPSIISGTSLLRRRFFDMFISLLDKEYFMALQNYSFSLRSRNFLLKNSKEDPEKIKSILDSYNTLLADHGALIVKKRLQYMLLLSQETQKKLSLIRPELENFQIRMRYHESTVNRDLFQKKLENDLRRDILKGFTSSGPHQDEFEFIVDEKSLRSYGSRGQLRTVSFALKLASFHILKEAGEMPGSAGSENIVLVDDVLGDLDSRAKEAFFTEVAGKDQIFYTFTEIPPEIDKKSLQVWKILDGKAFMEE